MENTQTPTTINTVEHNGITILRTNVCKATQAWKHKNPMAWVFYDGTSPISFKSLKSAKEAVERYATKYSFSNSTDFKGNYWTRGPVNGRFDVITLTEQEWRARQPVCRANNWGN
jgi:hypothetical protein